MKKQKLSVQSLCSKNIADLNYMKLHKRMYLLYESSGRPNLYLRLDNDCKVFVSLTPLAAKEFSSYEMSFDTMLLLFSTLCIDYGKIKLPF